MDLVRTRLEKLFPFLTDNQASRNVGDKCLLTSIRVQQVVLYPLHNLEKFGLDTRTMNLDSPEMYQRSENLQEKASAIVGLILICFPFLRNHSLILPVVQCLNFFHMFFSNFLSS